MTEYYTSDGIKVKTGRFYYTDHGEVVSLKEVVENQDGVVRYLVTPFYEGEAMEMVCYGNSPIERSIPYEVEGVPTIVNHIFAKEPTKKLGEKTKDSVVNLEAIATTVGRLSILEKEIKAKIAILENDHRAVDEKGKKACDSLKVINDEIDTRQQELDQKRQQLSELEDSIGDTKLEEIIACSGLELIRLRKDEFKLECLKAGGVDNWEHYDDSLEEYRKRYPEG
jgi:hypothetical protein